jgi:hypothetical protein
MIRRLLPLLVFAAALGAGAAASAQDRPGMFLDPGLLPPDTRPGECVTRRLTGPGGAYRWDRIECEAHIGGGDFDRYGRQPLRVVDGPLRGDRYGGWSQGGSRYEEPGYGDQGYGGQGYGDRYYDDDRYGAPYPTYRVAGRDADGYLVWPGKLP